MRGIAGNGEIDKIRSDLPDHLIDCRGVLREETVEHEGNADFCPKGFRVFGGGHRRLESTFPADDLIMMLRISVQRDAEIHAAAVHVSFDDGLLILPAHQGDACCHSVMIKLDMLCGRRGTNDLHDIRMIEGLIIHCKTGNGGGGQRGSQLVEPADTPQGILQGNVFTRSAVDIAVFAPGVAPGDQKVKIHFHK